MRGAERGARKKERVGKRKKTSVDTFDRRRPPKVCCTKVVSCNLGLTFFSPPTPSKHIDCIDATRSLHKQ